MDHAPRSSGSHLVVWVGVPPTFSENPGEFSSPWQNSGSHLPVILGKSGNLHHQTASFVGAPIMSRERCHVTQPRARINVCCSRAGHEGASEGRGNLKKRTAKASKGQQKRLRNRKGWRTGRTAGDDRGTSGTKRKAGRQKRLQGNKHEIPGR